MLYSAKVLCISECFRSKRVIFFIITSIRTTVTTVILELKDMKSGTKKVSSLCTSFNSRHWRLHLIQIIALVHMVTTTYELNLVHMVTPKTRTITVIIGLEDMRWDEKTVVLLHVFHLVALGTSTHCNRTILLNLENISFYLVFRTTVTSLQYNSTNHLITHSNYTIQTLYLLFLHGLWHYHLYMA